jgi:SAM-dependent methyltransferase
VHAEALAWVRDHAPRDIPMSVLDVGGRNINGTARECFPLAFRYDVLDIRPGEGVSIVADAASWMPQRTYDVVVCTEVFEHTPDWPHIVETIRLALRPGGTAILTMAGPGRARHSGVDGEHRLLDGEHYANVEPADLERELKAAGFDDITVDYRPGPGDTRAVAVRPV